MNESIWIAVAIIAFIALIIFMVARAAKKQAVAAKQQLQQALAQKASTRNLSIGQTEFFRNRVVGLSSDGQHIIYILTDSDGIHTDLVELNDISHCEVASEGSKIVTTAKNGKQKIEEHVNAISLQLYNGKRLVSSLLFYSEIEDGGLELLDNRKKAERWKSLLERREQAAA